MIMARAVLLLCLSASASAAGSSLNIDDPQRLRAVERSGFTFGEVVVGLKTGGAGNAALYQHDAYRAIVDSLAEDLERLKRADRELGVTIKARHRLFDVNWLKSASAHFELVGVVNRMDRDVFNPESCGEIRERPR
jgi:hypothetical protein